MRTAWSICRLPQLAFILATSMIVAVSSLAQESIWSAARIALASLCRLSASLSLSPIVNGLSHAAISTRAKPAAVRQILLAKVRIVIVLLGCRAPPAISARAQLLVYLARSVRGTGFVILPYVRKGTLLAQVLATIRRGVGSPAFLASRLCRFPLLVGESICSVQSRANRFACG